MPLSLPDLDPTLYAALRDDIARRGVLVPILMDQEGNILDGRIRQQIASELGIRDLPTLVLSRLTEQDRAEIRISSNCYRRHLRRAQIREILHHEIRRTPDQSNRQIAGRVGVSDKTIAAARRGAELPHLEYRTGRDGKRYPAARPSVFASTRGQATAIRRQLAALGDDAPQRPLSPRALRTLVGEKERADQSVRSRALPTGFTVQNCDFRNAELPSDAALAYCDCPWLSDWADSRRDFARSVFGCLKPGGIAAVYTGQFALDQFMMIFLEAGFRYKWILACLNAGGGGSIRDRGQMRTAWRPVILFVKPGAALRTPHTMLDVLRTQDRDKDAHAWQQPTSEAVEIVRCLSRPGDVVVDLTCGSGTSGVACARVGGRRYVGVEIDARTARLARRRIVEEIGTQKDPAIAR